jgi:hypothetical protein
MPATDQVPCFYTGQDYRWERPAKIRTRAEVRKFRDAKLGEFREGGRVFLFFKSIATAEQSIDFWDKIPLGVGNLLPFAKPHSNGDKLHYEMPRAGDRGLRRHNLYRRRDRHGKLCLDSKQIHVSSRSLFSQQTIPAVRLAV